MDLLSAATAGIIVLGLVSAWRATRWMDVLIACLAVIAITSRRVDGFIISLIVASALAAVTDLQGEGHWKKYRALLNLSSIAVLGVFLLVLYKRGHSFWFIASDGLGLLEEQGMFKAVLSSTRGIPDTIVLSCLALAACAAWFLNAVLVDEFEDQPRDRPLPLLGFVTPLVLLRLYPLLEAGPRGYGGVSTQLLLLAGGGIVGAFFLATIMPRVPLKLLPHVLALAVIGWSFVLIPFANTNVILCIIAAAVALETRNFISAPAGSSGN